MTASISTSFLFLQHDNKWEHEKPYSIMYQPPAGLKKNNFTLERRGNIEVRNIRELSLIPSIETQGFTLINLEPSSLQSEDFDDKEKVASHFLPCAAKAVKETLKASRVQFFDITVRSGYSNAYQKLRVFQVRRRHPDFPTHVGSSYAHLQPTSIVHIGALRILAIYMDS